MTLVSSLLPVLFMGLCLALLRARASILRRERIKDILKDGVANTQSPTDGLRRGFALPDFGSMSRKSRIALPLLVGCSVFILTRNPVLALLAWPALRLVDRLWKRYSESRAKARKEEEVLEFIDSLIQSLRSGLSLQQALEQSREDLGNEMRRDLIPILKELHMGAGLEESLSRAAASQDIPSLRLTLTVLALLHSRGGDLPRILERLRKRVAEGVEVRREARILTSQSRASGYLVSALPPVFLLIQGALNPKSLQPLLATPAGNLMIVVGLLLNAAAFVFIRRIVRQGE